MARPGEPPDAEHVGDYGHHTDCDPEPGPDTLGDTDDWDDERQEDVCDQATDAGDDYGPVERPLRFRVAYRGWCPAKVRLGGLIHGLSLTLRSGFRIFPVLAAESGSPPHQCGETPGQGQRDDEVGGERESEVLRE